MNNDTFEIAYNKEQLEYYSYIREILECPQVPYWMGNPSVQITNGIIYSPVLQDDEIIVNLDNAQQYIEQYKKNIVESAQKNDELFSRALLLIGIPSIKAPVQVFDRFELYISWIQEAKVIKTSHSKYYAMLLLFECEQKSFLFFKDVLGQEYNALDMQRILLRQIKEITIQCTGGPHLENQKNLYHFKKNSKDEENQRVSPLNIFIKASGSVGRKLSASISPSKKVHHQINHSHSLSSIVLPNKNQSNQSKQQFNPQQQQISTCTICLESNSDTIISILCEHYFHIKCLYRWREDTCPLCRYHQQPPLIRFCEKCNQCEGLWVCLVCGVRMCCGSGHDILGQGSHIYEHYLETQHRLSMDVETKFIFDASQAAFLHKMFYQEIMKNGGIQHLEIQEDKKDKKKNKLSEKISEFQQSISEQMQIQRVYFEQNISKQVKCKKQAMKQKKKKITDLQAELKQLEEQTDEIQGKSIKSEQAIQKLQKQLKIILDVQKFWKQKAQKKGRMSKMCDDKQKMEIKKINNLIIEKRQELKDYQRNINLQSKLKSNLGNDKVETEVYLGKEAKKKR